MLKEKNQQMHSSLNFKKKIIEEFNLTSRQVESLETYIKEIIKYNNHTNIVGKSTLLDPWKSHIFDSLQISKFIQNKESSILDMGTGAGLPGIVLSLQKYTNVSLVDSSRKKINFINPLIKKLHISPKVYCKRVERLTNLKFNYIVSRALSNLSKLFFYSQNFLNQNSVMVFLKGKTAMTEIIEASKEWDFIYEKHQSISDKRGSVLVINNLHKKHA